MNHKTTIEYYIPMNYLNVEEVIFYVNKDLIQGFDILTGGNDGILYMSYGNVIFNNLVKFQDKNLKWFFFSSTSHVYSLPKKKIKINEKFKKKAISKYGLTKLKAEKYIKKKLSKSNIPYCIGRIFSFTHINQEDFYLIPSIVKKIRKSKKNNIVFSNMNHYRDFVSVADICEAIKLLWIKKSKGEFNIASGKATYVKNIVKFLCKIYKKNPIFVDNGKSYLVGDIKKIKKLGWKPKKNTFQILNEYLAIT